MEPSLPSSVLCNTGRLYFWSSTSSTNLCSCSSTAADLVLCLQPLVLLFVTAATSGTLCSSCSWYCCSVLVSRCSWLHYWSSPAAYSLSMLLIASCLLSSILSCWSALSTACVVTSSQLFTFYLLDSFHTAILLSIVHLWPSIRIVVILLGHRSLLPNWMGRIFCYGQNLLGLSWCSGEA